MFENVLSCFIILDRRGIFVFWANSFCESLGFPRNHNPFKIPTPTPAPDQGDFGGVGTTKMQCEVGGGTLACGASNTLDRLKSRLIC